MSSLSFSPYNQYGSGFRSKHSTESALVRVTNDLLMAVDDRFLSILVFLDLIAAFDTISHSILLKRLSSIGSSGIPLAWLTYYLSNRTQFVQLKCFPSQPYSVSCGVHQGSVLGPILSFKWLVIHLPHADDTKLYVST